MQSDNEFFVPITAAPTVDDITRALKGDRRLHCSLRVKAAMRILNHNPIEQFNFGPLNLNVVHAAQREAIDFIEHGYFSLPYPTCMYRCVVKFDNADVGYTIFMIDGKSLHPEEAKDYHGIACISIIHDHDHMIAMHSVNMLRTKRLLDGSSAVEIQLTKEEVDFWKERLDYDKVAKKFDEQSTTQLTEGALISMGLTMILNTKGVHKERREPPAKPNAARIKSGRAPLPYITRVSTTVYNAAVAPGEPGTHASPRPHLRRAHVRHYPERKGQPAYVKPIAAMLVNWDGRPLAPREAYEVPSDVPEGNSASQ